MKECKLMTGGYDRISTQGLKKLSHIGKKEYFTVFRWWLEKFFFQDKSSPLKKGE
jgi:hypothetical protein